MSETLQGEQHAPAPAPKAPAPAAASPALSSIGGRQVSLKSLGDSMHGGAAHGGAHAGAAMAETHETHSNKPADIAATGFQDPAHDIPFKSEMEKSFGVSFGHVRAYTGKNAQAATQKLGAHAYAVGDQIAFASASPSKATVAHELTHVLQYTGGGPTKKSSGGNGGEGGIDTSGEHEAEQVEAAVASGQSATHALGAAGAHEGVETSPAGPTHKPKNPQRSSRFGMGMTFSTSALEKSYEYRLWEQHPPIEIPIPAVPGLNFMVEPTVIIKAAGGVNWRESNLTAALGVEGTVGAGFSYGNASVASLYGVMEARASGGFEYKKSSAQWSLEGGIGLATDFRVGCKLGGILDYGFEFGRCEMGKVTGVSWKNGRFEREKIGWEWGEKPREFFHAISVQIERARRLLASGAAAIQQARQRAEQLGRGALHTGAAAVHWVQSWF